MRSPRIVILLVGVTTLTAIALSSESVTLDQSFPARLIVKNRAELVDTTSEKESVRYA